MYSTSSIRPTFLSRQLGLSTSAVATAFSNRQAAVARLQERLSTGKEINRASDDPAGFGIAKAMEASLQRYGQYERTMSSARLWLDESESALHGINDVLTDAYEEAIRSINSTLSSDDLEAVAQEIEGLISTLVDRLNAKAGNEYVFGGAKTTETPFVLDNSGSADSAGVTYYGDGRSLSRTIGDDLDIEVNLDGLRVNELPSGNTLTGVLSDLADAIRAGDVTAIETALDANATARSHVLNLTGGIGALSQRMQIAESQLQNTIFSATQRKSHVEDADIAETLTELQMQQLRMQAATQALLSIRQLDITNFLN